MRAIKKIIALATGATMLGATIMGAMAADLADFPSPLLIKDTTFDADIVYGVNADPSDIMGLVDAVAAISVIETGVTVEGAAETMLEGDSWKVETSSKKLELGEVFTDVQSSIDEAELDALADGTFKTKTTADYEQELRFAGNLLVSYEEDTDNDIVNAFLTIDNDQDILNYSLTFTTTAETDIDTSETNNELEDFKDQTIKILGVDYTMTKVSYVGTNNVELTLMGGALLDTLEQGQVKTYTLDGKDYEVEVVYIGETGTVAGVKFKVNGETTDTMTEGDTFTLADGTDIGVREILEEEAGEVTADMVEFYLGADKIVLADDSTNTSTADGTMDVGEERMDEVAVMIKGTEAGGDFPLEEITLVYTADDDYWLDVGETLSENVEEPEAFINWDINWEGMTEAATQMIELVGAGDDEVELKVQIQDGKADIPLGYSANASHVRLGDRNDRLILGSGTTTSLSKDQYTILTTGSGTISSEGEKSYVLQYRGADSASGDTTAKLKFKNIATGESFERTMTGISTGSPTATLTLGGEEFEIVNTSDAQPGCDDFSINISNGATRGQLVTTGEALITIADNEASDYYNSTSGADNTMNTINITIVESDADIVENGTTTSITTTLTGGDANEIGVGSIGGVTMVSDPDDSDIETAMTMYGALITTEQITDAPDEITIEWPMEQRVGQAFVSSGAVKATIVGTTGGAVLKKVTIPLAKSDDDVLAADPAMNKKNYLLVGGPCANRATAKVLGSGTTWPACGEGFEEGIGRILVEEMNGKVAMVVAGMTALDTTRATRVLKDYGDYDLSGDEVEVLGTTATPQTVRKVS
jgi:hypothetical protein